MAEDVDGSNPRKKIKLDEETCNTKSEIVADNEVTGSNSEVSKDNDGADHCEVGSSETPKAEDLSQEGRHSDSDSNISGLSDFSDLSGEESWKAHGSGAMSWVYRNMEAGVSPRDILEHIIPDVSMIPNVDDFTLWKLVISIMSEPPPREKLPNINTIGDIIDLMKKCNNIMVLTGAGVSVSCGIPDFRSRNGVYARLAVDFPDLPDPQAMFDIRYFKNDQRPFFKFAKEIFPGQFEPSKCHKFIKLIETQGKLLRNYTQNIDTLEQVAGISNTIQCHGSFATATCMTCSYKCPGDDIKSQIMEQIIPMCPKCDPQVPLSVMKPDIVFFGESLPEEFHQQMSNDKDQCDLLIVIGSSLKVRPVALIPNSLPPEVPQILINKEHLRNLNFDVELLGDCDIIIGELCRQLGEGWESLASKNEPLTQISMDELLTPPATPTEKDNMQGNSPTASQFDYNSGNCLHSQPDSSLKTPTSDCTMALSDKEKTEQKDDEEMVTTSEEGKSIIRQTNKDQTSSGNGHVGSADGTDIRESSTQIVDSTVKITKEGASEQSADSTTDSSEIDKQIKEESAVASSSASTSGASKIKVGAVTNNAEDSISDIDSNLSELNCNSNRADKRSEVRDTLTDLTDCSKDSLAGPSSEPDLKAMWQPKFKRFSVAQRLGPNQYCLIPPHRYVFTEAEVFTMLGTESDTDDSMADLDEDDSDNDLEVSLDKNKSDISLDSSMEQTTSKTDEAAESGNTDDKDLTDKETRPVESEKEIISSGETLPVTERCDSSVQKLSSMDSGDNEAIGKQDSGVDKDIEGEVPSGEG